MPRHPKTVITRPFTEGQLFHIALGYLIAKEEISINGQYVPLLMDAIRKVRQEQASLNGEGIA